MTPAQREAWVRETFIQGMAAAHRPSKFIHRIPFKQYRFRWSHQYRDRTTHPRYPRKEARINLLYRADLG